MSYLCAAKEVIRNRHKHKEQSTSHIICSIWTVLDWLENDSLVPVVHIGWVGNRNHKGMSTPKCVRQGVGRWDAVTDVNMNHYDLCIVNWEYFSRSVYPLCTSQVRTSSKKVGKSKILAMSLGCRISRHKEGYLLPELVEVMAKIGNNSDNHKSMN